MTDDAVVAELTGRMAEMKARLAEIEGSIRQLEREHAETLEKHALLQSVLAKVFGNDSAAAVTPVAKNPGRRLNAIGPVRGAYDVLRQHGAKMHVRDILAVLYERGFKTNTSRPEAMLSGTLRQSSKFRACGGDFWALAEWASDELPPSTQKRVSVEDVLSDLLAARNITESTDTKGG